MRRLLTIIALTAVLPASHIVLAGDSNLSGSTPPASGITGATTKPHPHHAKSAKTTGDGEAKKGAAAGSVAAPKVDPAVNRLNTVLPP